MKRQKVGKQMTNDLNWQPQHHEYDATKYHHRRQEAPRVSVDRQVYHLATDGHSEHGNAAMSHVSPKSISWARIVANVSLNIIPSTVRKYYD